MVNDWNLQRGGRLLEAGFFAIFGRKLPIFLPERRGWAIIRAWAIIRIITIIGNRPQLRHYLNVGYFKLY